MADDNRPLKYLRYAIGEIALVVIGILIALYINNWNEQQKQRKKIDEVLIEVEKELIMNIELAREVLDQYHEIDSLSNIFFFDSLTIEDYRKGDNSSLKSLGRGLYGWQVETDAATKLKDYSEAIDADQETVISGLKYLYGTSKAGMELFFEQMKASSNKINEDKTDFPWYSDTYNNVYSDEALAYLVSDPIHRNNVSEYIRNAGNYNRLIEEFEIRARVSYKKIHNYLQKKYPDYSEPIVFEYDAGDYKHLTGTYIPVWRSSRLIESDSTVISIENDTLFYSPYLIDGSMTKREIIPVNDSYFRTESGFGFYQIVYDAQGNVVRVDFSADQIWEKEKKIR